MSEKILDKEIKLSKNIEIPSRSILYSLKPIGLGTPMVESLSSYIFRLANAHHLSTNQLLRFILSKSDWRNLEIITIESLNGMDSSEYIIESLENLTKQSSLQYLCTVNWKGYIKRGYLRKQKTWCPSCFKEWKESGIIIYEPLIWYINQIDLCYYHHTPLETLCPKCQQFNRIVESKVQLGVCSHCSSFLGFYVDKENNTISKDQVIEIEYLGKIIGSEEAINFLKSRSFYSFYSSFY